jgi:RNA polymerase sigma factor (sigma-70 family)
MGSVTYLIGRLKNGSSSALAHLMERYYPRQVRQARNRLRGAPASVLDADDVATVAFWELWQAVTHGRPLSRFLSNTQSLLIALATLTRDQVSRARRDAGRACRDARRTVHALTGYPDADNALVDALGTDPWPVVLQALESREAVDTLIALLPQQRQKTLVRLLLDDRPLADIARELDCSVRTVQRLYAEVVDYWRSHSAARKALGET